MQARKDFNITESVDRLISMAESGMSNSLKGYIRRFLAHLRKRLPIYFILMIIVFGVLFVFRDDIYDTFIRRHEEKTFYFDEHGLPMTDYGWTQGVYVGPQFNPLVIARGAQVYYDQMLDGNTTAAGFLNYTLNWLVENRVTQTIDNESGLVTVSHWLYNFSIYDQPAGWYSAMAEAEIAHTLAQAYDYSGNPIYLQILNETLNGFEVSQEIGGSMLIIDEVGNWYPEVIVPSTVDPTYPKRRILNGFLLGLEDLYLANEYLNQTRIKRLFDNGINSALQTLHLYEAPENWTFYQLNPVKYASVGYHHVHISITGILYNITGITEFQTYHERWKSWTVVPPQADVDLTERRLKEISYGLLFMSIAAGMILLIDFMQMQVRTRVTSNS
ncbi:MAG: D-glucuronyl C5-epimerase family protein [Candidatus Thorarchaeota archaeon]